MKRKRSFDADAFYAALDGERMARELTWKKVADESGVSASTLTRIAQGKRPDVDSLAALAAWSGLNVDMFVKGRLSLQEEPERLAMISAFLRTDPQLNEEDATTLDEIVKAAYNRLRRAPRQA